MNTISRRELFSAAGAHPDSRDFVAAFFRVARRAEWRSLVDVRRQYPRADLVGDCLVIDVLGNHYRQLLCANFRYQALFFKKLVTHAEYDRIEVRNLCQHHPVH